jgi:TIR domain
MQIDCYRSSLPQAGEAKADLVGRAPLPKVFISHQNEDSSLATYVADRVRRNGLTTYLDVIDDALKQDGSELSDHIRLKMAECDQLVAIVSSNTKASWWVPWEIGVASEKDFRIANYAREYVDLPSYLKQWPTLRSEQDIDAYCEISKLNAAQTRIRIDEAFTELRKEEALRRGVRDFHKQLKTRLGQR